MSDALTIGSMFTGTGALDDAVLALFPNAKHLWAADTITTDPKYGPNIGTVERDWQPTPRPTIITAGFPCQDISSAGKRKGIARGTRSGLWLSVVDAVRALRPDLLFLENVAALAHRGGELPIVLGHLADLGFDAEWTCLPASAVGAPHARDRWFAIAWPTSSHADRPRPSVSVLEAAKALVIPSSDGHFAPNPLRWGTAAWPIARWERITGQEAPFPPLDDKSRLTVAFAAWFMGLHPDKTQFAPSRAEKLLQLANAVVIRQAIWAYAILLDRIDHLPHGLEPSPCSRSDFWNS